MSVRHYHELAMAEVDKALAAKRVNDFTAARAYYLEAITLEQLAIDAMTEESTPATARILRDSLQNLRDSAEALEALLA